MAIYILCSRKDLEATLAMQHLDDKDVQRFFMLVSENADQQRVSGAGKRWKMVAL